MITIAQEPIATARPAIELLLPAHWDFVGDEELACEPNWTMYQTLEDRGVTCVWVMRENQRPAGYMVAILHPHANSISALQATIATYFIEDRANRALLLRRLFTHAQAALEQRKVQRLTVDTAYAHSAGRLLEMLGFRPVKIGYRMNLSEQQESQSA